ncbi:hypothetical protein [Candidatus Nitrospira bockiana]
MLAWKSGGLYYSHTRQFRHLIRQAMLAGSYDGEQLLDALEECPGKQRGMKRVTELVG